MGPKHDPHDVLKLIVNDSQDFDLQAGSRGLTTAQAASRYLRSPGHFLALIRFFRRETVDQVKTATAIPAEVLSAYERGERSPSLKDLAQLARHYGADLRVLLEVFKHVEEDSASSAFGLAAQFSGELDEEDKVSLQELMKYYARRNKKKK